MIAIKRLYRWSYEETEHFVADSLVLRQFCRVYLKPVPDDTTLIRWANQIGPQTVEQINERETRSRSRRQTHRAAQGRADGAS